MRLQVLLDQKVIFASSFSVGRLLRSEGEKDYPAEKLSFSFKAGRPIKWLGYRDDEPISPAKQEIECNIWMAGADPDYIILGVDFSRADTGLMNTLHLAYPTEKSSSEIENGLVVVTFPINAPTLSNRLPDPTSSSATPPAGAGGAPSVAADH